jgi:hypothetical protein
MRKRQESRVRNYTKLHEKVIEHDESLSKTPGKFLFRLTAASAAAKLFEMCGNYEHAMMIIQ